MSTSRVLIYLLRRDLRFADNPVFHEIIRTHQQSHSEYTHLLPVYIFPANQVEISGFLSSSSSGASPYAEARSAVGNFWRCGEHRAKFTAESVFDLKKTLQASGNGVEIRVGITADVVSNLLKAYKKNDSTEVVGVWLTGDEGVEERREERDVQKVCEEAGTSFKIWSDEKYFVDDRDVPNDRPTDLPDLFTAYRKTVEPLREAPRKPLSVQGNLPPLPAFIPEQDAPFEIPESLDDVIKRLLAPLEKNPDLAKDAINFPSKASSAHPFTGGEGQAHDRVKHLLSNGSMTRYKDTRNGMIGNDFSTKLAAYLSLGCISARQIHTYLLDFEDGRTGIGRLAPGYGKGENKGTGWTRFELLWRDYMRLCARKHRHKLYRIEGFGTHASGRGEKSNGPQWRTPGKDPEAKKLLLRFLRGETGIGMIDASQRELWLTGYTSNRARQNVASFLSKNLHLDWRLGAEWYESQLVDYDSSSNWGNWQYVALGDRTFNPVKQSYDYDAKGEYIKMWVPELSQWEGGVEGIFQGWKIPSENRQDLGLQDTEWISRPLARIEYRPGGGGGGRGGRGGKGGYRGNRGKGGQKKGGGGG